MKSEHKIEYLLKPSVSNAEQELPMTLLVEQIIEIATDHANILGIGFLSMEGKDMGWVLSRLSVEMKRWPRVGERYTITTWIETWNRHFSERCFSVEDLDGNVLGYVRTVWMIIDLKSHKSYGTAGLEVAPEYVGNRECPILRQQRHKHFEPQVVHEYTFKYTDLDFYRHVNTVRYISLLLNQFSLEEFDNNHLYRFEIAFMHEAHYGETAHIKGIEESLSGGDTDAFLSPVTSLSYTYEMNVADTPILRSRLFFTPK